jgi:hypothetical protein
MNYEITHKTLGEQVNRLNAKLYESAQLAYLNGALDYITPDK